MKHTGLWAIALSLSLGVGACVAIAGSSAPAVTRGGELPAERQLVIFAAASLTDAVDALGANFAATRPGLTIVTNYAGSSSLATQLLEGARADLFAAANLAQMDNVAQAGLLAGDPQLIATNRLVAIVPADNPAEIATFTDLARPGVRLVLAVPGVPVRDYTDALLATLQDDPAFGPDFVADLYANLASEEANVRQVAAKVALGEADAGIVYATDVTPELVDDVRQLSIPGADTSLASYPLALLADADEPLLAAEFRAFVLSAEGQAILQEWGFGPRPE